MLFLHKKNSGIAPVFLRHGFFVFFWRTLFNTPTHNTNHNRPTTRVITTITMTKCENMEFRTHGFYAEYCISPESSCKLEDSYRCQDDSSRRNKKRTEKTVRT